MDAIKTNDSLIDAIRASIKLALLLLCAILVASCSHVRRDGPPPFPVDVSKIPDAVPKPEPLSKHNLPVYRVKGQTYHTMTSSKNFQEVGIASWYGTLFHERRTSSGERYDMLGMTAAHKTLPLPTYVEVLNLKNKRKIIVKVNDRGPFKPGRIIDLSYVAAKKLGMIGHGTTYVKIKAIDPYAFQRNLRLAQERQAGIQNDEQNAHTPIIATNKSKRFIQVGSFSKQAQATHLKNRLKQTIHMPILITKNKHALYLVKIGPIQNAQSEAAIKKRLRKLRIVT